ncbi:hypothetical protein ACFLZW_03725 [Chloroflexota bacterium]
MLERNSELTPDLETIAGPQEGQTPYLDPTASLRGWPGYRTRPGRSGLDPLDNHFEWAHMQGVFLRRLFTGSLRTKNPIYLNLMGLIGGAIIAPIIILFFTNTGSAVSLCCIMNIYVPVGAALLVNLYLNIVDRSKDEFE